MECPECQHENRQEAKFCIKCGTKLEVVCSECGARLPSEASFCDECGTRILGGGADPSKAAVPKLEDMHTQLQSLIPDKLAQKYMSAEQQAAGENRPITALFADISGFTLLSNTQSSETTFQLVQDCFRELVGIVARYEGSISGFRGDGLLALFGAPILHENDAERAILAAIDMRGIMQDKQLQVSIGINTAMVTVGEVQTQLHREYTAYGTDVNLAKRLQEAAEPGQILVGTGTHRLTRRMFDFDATESLSVKGFTEAVTAYSVQQAKERPEKLRGIEGLRARMIGREHEFADLKEAADAWLEGQGQIVSVIGEAGIGKSRLVQELREYLDMRLQTQDSRRKTGDQEATTATQQHNNDEPASSLPHSPAPSSPHSLSLEGRCVSIGQPISYWPFLDILRAHFGLGEDDDEPTRARKVTESITQLMPQGVDETLPLLGNLLSVKFDNELDDRLKFASPEQIRHQTLMRLRDTFRALAEQQPLLLILDDLHWSDDLSLDLISLLMDELASAPLLLLCVYRPEKEHRVWQLGDQARRKCLDRYTELTLHPLSSHQSRLLVESLLEIENLPEGTKNTILTKSEGNPFFIEEVIRSLIEQDMVYRDDDHWKARDEIAGISVPDTIQSVVLARVDRLASEARYVLQCASVIGRLFRHRLLKHIANQEQELDQYIDEFESKELIYEERTVPELEYAFKHAFTQEATYEGILEQQRMEFHHHVAEGIERLYKDYLEEYYEELAHHYSRSGNAEKAMTYLLEAGEKAKRSYLNDVSISYYKQALDMMEQHGMHNNEWELKALRGLGEVYMGMSKISDSAEMFQKAAAIAEQIKLPPRQLARLYHWILEALFWQRQFDGVIQYGEKGLQVLGDDTECLEAALVNSGIAIGNARKGNGGEYLKYTRRNMTFISNIPYSEEVRSPYVHIIELVAYGDRDLDSAWKWINELEARASQHHDMRGVASACKYMGSAILLPKGDHAGALSSFQRAIDISESIGGDKHLNWYYTDKSWVLYNLGRIDEAKASAKASLKLLEQMGENTPNNTGVHFILAQTAICHRRWDEAISHIQRAIELLKKAGGTGKAPGINMLFGKIYLERKDYHSAIEAFQGILPNYNAMVGISQAYAELGMPEKSVDFLHSLAEQEPEKYKSLASIRWYLEQVELSEEFSYLEFVDVFRGDEVDPAWSWVDEFSDCAYVLPNEEGIEIHASNGRDLFSPNLSTPRLMRNICGDFAIDVRISSTPENKPQIGGLLVWESRNNLLRFERGIKGRNEMHTSGSVNGEHSTYGAATLLVDKEQEIHLRLERSGNEFTSYCSIDGKNWMMCGKAIQPMDDPVQVGIHAIGMIDRTIYCGEYREGTATLFRNFRIWTRE